MLVAMPASPTTPVLVFDGDCGFCTKSAHWLTRRGGAEARPAYSLPLTDDDLTRTLDAAGWMVDGEIRAWGAAAIAEALRHRGGPSALIGLLLTLPVIRVVADAVYAWVARHRHQMPGATDQCRIAPSPAPKPWKNRVLALVIAAQIVVPAMALTHPPSRFGFQMYSGLGGTEVVVRDAEGRLLKVDRSLLAASLRPDLPYSRTLPEYLCSRIPEAKTVTVKDSDDERSVPC